MKIVLVVLLLILAMPFIFISCISHPFLTEQDLMLSRNIKSKLKDVGDKVKVSDVYPGDWREVCAFGYGFYAKISTHFSEPPEEANIMNNAIDSISDDRGDSAVIFKYNDTDMEIFRTAWKLPGELIYQNYKEGECISKDDAYFYLFNKHSLYEIVMVANLETIKRVDLERKSKETIQNVN